MNKEEAKNLPKVLRKPITHDLPAHLKDPANYEKVQRVLLETLSSPHSHSEMETWATCKSCQRNMANMRLAMQKLGFNSPAQYQAWKKIMDIIINKKRVPLPKYEPEGDITGVEHTSEDEDSTV